MTASTIGTTSISFVPDEAMLRLIRERDNLFVLHEALAEVELATSLEQRLRIFVTAIQKIGFGRVSMTLRDSSMAAIALVTAGLSESETDDLRGAAAPGAVWRRRLDCLARLPHLRISTSFYLDVRDPWVASEFHDSLPSRLEPHGRPGWSPQDSLLVPVRGPRGEIVATLLLDDPADRARPTLARVRTVELFAQQVATILDRARLLEEAQRERVRAEAMADVARAVSAEHRALADRYTRLVESAADAIATIDERGRLTSVNQALERATGRLRSSLLGEPFVSLFDAGDEHGAATLLRATLGGDPQKRDMRYRRLDGGLEGDLRSCAITSTPIVEAGRVTGVLAIMRDVTDEKRLADQLMQQEKLAAVGQLVSGVAHELNNPLAGVMAYSQLLLTSPTLGSGSAPVDTIDARDALVTIHEEAKRAAKIVSNLLTFARQHQPERTLADLNRVVTDTLELRRYALRVRQIEVDARLDDNLPLTWADPFQLQQVVLNLIANAEQALESWGGERRITITTSSVCRLGRERGELLVLRVADSGPGIAPEHLSKIFNPFFTTKPVGEGTGLGLSISDGIVREHGGRIRAEVGPTSGASFVVELPYVPPPDSELVDVMLSPRAARQAQRVLIVDDEASIRGAVTSYLRSQGHAVDTVASGREALALVAQRSYDAILLDLRMPDIPGDVLYRELHEVAPHAAEHVVFLTGDTQNEAARGFLQSTGRPTISKPFLLDELAAVLLAS
jgi:PAS domain S-box-containing protein